MGQIKVSVIVPVYNAENFIQSTMHMLCKSTLHEIEILAINDGSKDDSLTVLGKCAEADKRIKVIDKPNGGIFDARNRGLKEVSGEYICFCDQDDIVEPDMYEVMYNKAKEQDCELAMCSTGRNIGGKKMPYWTLDDEIIIDEDVRTECFLPLIFNKSKDKKSVKNIKMSDAIWKCMVSTKFIKNNKLKFRRFVNYEDDRLFLMDILARAKKVILISEILYYWTISIGSQSHSPAYVEDLYEKDLKFQSYTLKVMRAAGCEDSCVREFEYYNSVYRYSRLVENEANRSGISRKQHMDVIKKIYDENNFDEKIRAVCYFPTNLFARKFTCILLEKHLTLIAFYFWKTYTAFCRKFRDKGFWTAVEKKVIGN